MKNQRPNSIVIKGTGKYVPEKIVTNDDLAKIVDTSELNAAALPPREKPRRTWL